MKTKLQLLIVCLFGTLSNLSAQISGTVYRDFNGDGTRQNVAPNFEPGVAEIIIHAFDANGTLVSSDTSDKDGLYSMPYTVPVRVEFIIPTTGNCAIDSKENTGFSGDGNNVRFVNASTSTLNYGVLFPDDYTPSVNPMVYLPIHYAGNPLGGGTSGAQVGFRGFEYNSNGTILSPKTITQASVGSLWGVAYSKQAKKIFTSAFLKRQVGLGPMGSGGIYMLEPTATSFNVTQFYDMDANGYRTRAASSALAYGQGSSYTVDANGFAIMYNGPIDLESGFPEGLGVIGTNIERTLPAAMNADSYDPAAFDQVGKVGLGDLDISDDGKFLFVMNLYSRKVYRLELNDAYNPTSVISVTSYPMPSVTVSNGQLRPFAVQYHRGKVYAGAVASGENGGDNIVDGATDLYAHVFEMNDPTGVATFNTTPILSYPLNYQKGYAVTTLNTAANNKWFPWTNNSNSGIADLYGETIYPCPVLSNIEFTDRGDMIMNFFDRMGHQQGYYNYKNLSTTTATTYQDVGGDVLIAGRDCGIGNFVLENNGSYNSNGTVYTGNATNNEGPGSGEFFYEEYAPDQYHHETSQGSCAMVRGSMAGIFSLMDPVASFQGGVGRFYTDNGTSSNRTVLYNGTDGEMAKANGLGDIEYAGEEVPIELGNRVWLDANKNGIQDAGENGIENVTIELFCDTNNDGVSDGSAIATVNTDADGYWYFNISNVTDGDCVTAGNQTGLQPNKQYIVKIGSSDWTGGAGIGDLSSLALSIPNATVTGILDGSDNDATLVSTIPQIVMNTTKLGENNHTYDFGLVCTGTINVSSNYTPATCPVEGITSNNDASLEIVTLGDKVAMSTTGTPTTLYASADIVTAGSYSYTAQNGDIDSFYVRVWSGSVCYMDTIIVVEPARCCPTINSTVPALNAAYCSGEMITTMDFSTNAIATDSIKLVMFNDKQTDWSTMYNTGNVIATEVITGVATTVSNSVSFANIQLPTLIGTANDTLWFYAVYIDNTGDTTCKIFLEKSIILKSQPVASISGNTISCNASTVALTSGAASTYTWGKLPDATTLATSQTFSTTPPASSATTYWLVTTNSGACVSDTVYHTVTASNGIIGIAFRDYNSDGIMGSTEVLGFENIKVRLYDNSGVLIDSTTTDAYGQYAFPTVSAGMGQVKIEFVKSTYPANTQETFNGTNNGTDVQFVTAPNCSVNLGLKEKGDYCGTNPLIVTPIFVDGASTGNATAIDEALYSLNYNDFTAKTTEATRTETGSTWGLAYSKKDKKLYSAAFLKRHVGLKDGKLGMIYMTDKSIAGSPTTPWLDVSTLGLSGNWQFLTDATRGLGDAGSPSLDSLAFSHIATTGLGDIDISEDETKLYAMDLINKQLLIIDIATKTLVGAYPVPSVCSGIAAPNYYAATAQSFTATDGKLWKNGYLFNVDNNAQDVSFYVLNPNDSFYGTTDATLYNTSARNQDNMLYSFPVVNGNYTVKLHLSTTASTWASNMDINAEGVNVFSNLSVYVEAGNVSDYGVIKTFTTTVIDGSLDINFSTLYSNGVQVSGFEIIPTSGQSIGSSRPFGIKAHKGKVYIGSICDASGSQNYNDLSGSIFEFNPQTSSFNVSPVLTIPLNYQKGESAKNFGTSGPTQWFPWTSVYPNNVYGKGIYTSIYFDLYPQPVLSDIEFDVDGSMIIGFFDRMGHQMGSSGNVKPTGQLEHFAAVGGDLVRAHFNGTSFVLENNGTAGAISTMGAGNGQGIGGGEFYFGDHLGGSNTTGASTSDGHFETLMGGLAFLPGSDEVITTSGDVLNYNSGGLAKFSNITGDKIAGFDVYSSTYGGVQEKSNGLGDIEILCDEAPIQIGNYVWFDTDQDGVQDPNENPISNIAVTLWKGGTQIASTTTNAKGEYYFSENSVAGVTWTGTGADTSLLPNTAYSIKIQKNTQAFIDTLSLTISNSTTNFGNDQTDNDASMVGNFATINLTTGDVGSINHTYDFGFTTSAPFGSIGNYVWTDANANGLNDEPSTAGINGVQVYLYDNASPSTPIDSMLTANNGANPGYYLFDSLISGTYFVKFPTSYLSGSITSQTTTPQTDNNSDANTTTGLSPLVVINASGSGQDKDNTTIDAGYFAFGSIGNYVWNDINSNGLNDEPASEGINGVVVYLYNNTNPSSPIDSTITSTLSSNPGYYTFDSLLSGTYFVKFPISNLSSVLTTQTTTSQTDNNSDANTTTGESPLAVIDAFGLGQDKDNTTIDAGFKPLGSIGNYVWTDANGNGLNDEPASSGINGLVVYLYDNANPTLSIDSTTTANNGGNPGYYVFDQLSSGTYFVQFPTTNGIDILTTQTTTAQTDNNSDASSTTGMSPLVIINTSLTGQDKDNTTIDAGFKPIGSIGNYVWMDDNANGLNDEPITNGINGVQVYLYDNANPSTPIDSMLTANNGGNPGYYLFDSLISGTYFVKFPTLQSNSKLTLQTTTSQTDNNSDANATTGLSPLVVINASGSGQDKDNTTIDAGYFELASLGNYVWNDLNKDGIQDANEVGVAGITVTLCNSAGTPILTTITDAYGYYLFDNLIPNDYFVGFSLPQNYVFTTTTGTSETDAANSDVNATTGKSTVVTLSSGEDQMNIDAGIYFQQPTIGSIGNYVWFDTNADGVQDPNEVGISGVTVTLCNSAGTIIASTITDANGNYIFTNLPAGNYSVGFTPPVGLVFSPSVGSVNGTTNSDANPTTGKTSTITLGSGEHITYVDAGLYPQVSSNASLGDKVWYDVNQNGIQDPTESGVVNVTVTLFESNGTTVISTTKTDAYGNYIFNNLTPSQYIVGFSNLPTNYVLTTNTATNASTNSDANPGTGLTPLITLEAGQHDMTWDAGIYTSISTNTNSIGDYVWNDINQDGIQDPNEKGVSGITVTLCDNTNTPIATTSTDANGNYVFPNLSNGTYSVGFSNLPTGYVFSPSGNGSSSTDSDPNPSTGKTSTVTLTGNTNITTLDAGIHQGNPNVGTASLGDKVWYDLNANGLQDPSESGVSGVTVTLYASNGSTVLSTTTTNALGYYVFTGLNASDYIVGFANLPLGYTITTKDADTEGIEGEMNSDVNNATQKTDIISLAIGEDKMSVDMGIVPPSGTASLGNFVWYDLNNDGLQTSGEPGVQGVSVVLYDATGTQMASTTTNANGEYYFIGLTPGTYSVGFSNLPDGYSFTTIDANSTGINGASNSDANVSTGLTASVTLAAGDNNLNLDAGIISSTVASVGDYVWSDINHDGIQDVNEPGIGGVLVTLYDNTNTPVASTITNPDGSYIFTNVNPGTYTMGFENLPFGMTFTSQESNPTSNTGSNVNPTTGLTPSFNVTAGTHNPTIDAGLITTPLAGLGNYVWYDNNRDGIQQSNEQGVAGIIVTLIASDGSTVLSQAVTNGNGGYSFTNLPAETYRVGFTNLPQTYTATKSEGPLNNALNSDMSPIDGKTSFVTLSVGEYNPNLDAGIMKPIAQLGNYVWNDIDKDGVQDANEVGVAGITVSLFNASNQIVSTTLTDAYGYYKFNPLESGVYHVSFTLPANYKFTLQDAGGNDETDNDVDPMTGITSTYTIVPGDSNMTVDAGIYFDQPTRAQLGNYVWLDQNQNGIQDPPEEGISGVTVTLYNSIPEVAGTMITDANGFYSFTDLVPGTYSVGFTPPVGMAFSQVVGPIASPSNSDANVMTGLTNTVTLSAGDEITYVDAGLYSAGDNFPLFGALGDKVWYDVNQNGVQENTEGGVEGVTVTLYQGDGTTVVSSTTTNTYGDYIFNSLDPGTYVIGFSNLPLGYMLTSTSGTDSTTNSDADLSTGKTPMITLNPGQFNMTYDAGIYNVLPSNTNSIGNYVWSDLNKDGIQDANEPGVSGITVVLYDGTTNTPLDLTSTDLNGNYLFPDLPNGSYYVGFSNLPIGNVFTQQGQGTSSTDSDPDLTTGLSSTVSLTGGTNDMTLDAGIYLGDIKVGKATLGDLVWYDLNNDGLQDVGESGVQGVTVTLFEQDGTTVINTTTTDALGNYIFTGLDPASYVVGFSNLPPGFTVSPQNSDAQGLNGEVNSDVNVTTLLTDLIVLSVGEDKMSIDMGIVPPTGSASLGNLVWFDLNKDGLQSSVEPGVQGVTVTLYDAAEQVVGVTTTDANGEYYFIGLIPDTYSVGFGNLPVGYSFTSKDADALGIDGALNSDADTITGLTTTVTLFAGDNNLNLDAGIYTDIVASVGDYVWFDANQNGLQDANENGVGGVLVTLIDNNGNPVSSAITNPDGGYIFTNVNPGDYTISFANIPFGMIFTTQETSPTSNTGSNVDPSTGITTSFNVVAGTHNPTIDAGITTPANAGLGNYVWNDVNQNGLQDASETGVAGVLVTLYASDETTVLATAVTDGNGAYSFTNLNAGSYVVGFSNLPNGATRTFRLGSTNDVANSDMNASGKTDLVTLVNGQYNPNIDAGIYFGIPLSAKDLVATNATLLDNNYCDVYWYTTLEQNTNYFDIERSSNGSDFVKVGELAASGNTVGKTTYSYHDDIQSIAELKNFYYRIKLHDIDGKISYSNILSVRKVAEGEISVYPTPFVDRITLNYMVPEATTIEIRLTDGLGKVIRMQTNDLDKGLNAIPISNLEGLAQGQYILTIVDINSGEKFVQKILK